MSETSVRIGVPDLLFESGPSALSPTLRESKTFPESHGQMERLRAWSLPVVSEVGVPVEGPLHLLGRLRLGREEYCQRLLTMLILDAPYPRWNSHQKPSEAGSRFLQSLDRLCFQSSTEDEPAIFVDEFDLPGRHDDEPGGAPDQAILWPGRVWMIELKTETGSHREGQLGGYLELARHHYPECQIDLTYLTPPMRTPIPATLAQMRFAHVNWGQVRPLIDETWGRGEETQQGLVQGLFSALDSIGSDWPRWRQEQLRSAAVAGIPQVDDHVAANWLALAVRLADQTGRDGRQRALDGGPEGLEELKQLQVQVRDVLQESDPSAPKRSVQPWLWHADTSGGHALTAVGAETGWEMRLSRLRSA